MSDHGTLNSTMELEDYSDDCFQEVHSSVGDDLDNCSKKVQTNIEENSDDCSQKPHSNFEGDPDDSSQEVQSSFEGDLDDYSQEAQCSFEGDPDDCSQEAQSSDEDLLVDGFQNARSSIYSDAGNYLQKIQTSFDGPHNLSQQEQDGEDDVDAQYEDVAQTILVKSCRNLIKTSVTRPVRVGDHVWAKMIRYPWWPGRILRRGSDEENESTDEFWVYFFGSKNCAWIRSKYIHLYLENKETMVSKFDVKYKSHKSKWQEAIKEAEQSFEKWLQCPRMNIEWFTNQRSKNNNVKKKVFFTTLGFFGSGNAFVNIVKSLSLNSKKYKFLFYRGVLDELRSKGAQTCLMNFKWTPVDVVKHSDVIISCFPDLDVLKKNKYMDFENNHEMLNEINPSKVFIEITTLNYDTFMSNSEVITAAGGLYIAAPILGSNFFTPAGKYIILISGEKEKSWLKKNGHCIMQFLYPLLIEGDSSSSVIMNLLYHQLMGNVIASLSEFMSLTRELGIDQKLVGSFMKKAFKSPFINHKAKAMVNRACALENSLDIVQKCMEYSLKLAHQKKLFLPTTSASNEMMEFAKRIKPPDEDIDIAGVSIVNYGKKSDASNCEENQDSDASSCEEDQDSVASSCEEDQDSDASNCEEDQDSNVCNYQEDQNYDACNNHQEDQNYDACNNHQEDQNYNACNNHPEDQNYNACNNYQEDQDSDESDYGHEFVLIHYTSGNP